MKKQTITVLCFTILLVGKSFGQWGNGTMNTLLQTTNGNVGIGISNPSAKLNIYESKTTVPLNTALKIGAYMNNAGTGTFMDFNLNFTGTFPNWIGGRIGSVYETNSVGANRAALVFHTNDDNNATLGAAGTSEKMRIQGNGNVGIGSAAPVAKLTIWDNNNTSDESQMIRLGISSIYDYRIFRQRADGVLRFDGTQTNFSSFRFSTTAAPNALSILNSGNICIGLKKPLANTLGANALLTVDGKIACKELVVVDPTKWADFVFDKNYQLMPLQDVEIFYNINKHLPAVPSENEVKTNGINTAEMEAILLQKIEELTLYIVQQQKEINDLKKEIKK